MLLYWYKYSPPLLSVGEHKVNTCVQSKHVGRVENNKG